MTHLQIYDPPTVDGELVDAPLEFELCRVKQLRKPKPGDRPKPEDLLITPPDGVPLVPTPRLISPSQLDTFAGPSGCERKWGFQYVDGRRQPSTKAQEMGVALHGQLEGWLAHGTPPASELLMTSGALQHFPAPRSKGLEVEGVFVFRVRMRGMRWVYFWGFMDVMVQTLVETEIFDLKTTSDLKWAKVTMEELSGAQDVEEALRLAREDGKLLDEDTQALVYAIAGMLTGRRRQARLHWVYVQTRGAKACRAVPCDIHWDEAVERFTQKFLAASKIRDLREIPSLTVLSLMANSSACGAYGGCAFLADCNDVSPASSLTSMFAQSQLASPPQSPTEEQSMTTMMSRLDSVMKQKGEAGTPVQAIGAAAAKAAATTPAAAKQEAPAADTATAKRANAAVSLADRLKAAGAAPEASGEATTAASKATATTVEVATDKAPDKPKGTAVDINGWTGDMVCDAHGRWVITVQGETFKHVSEEEVLKMAKLMTPQAPPPPPKEEAKPKAARAPRAPRAAASKEPADIPLSDVVGFHLYLDILPAKGISTRDIEEVLAPARANIEAQLAVPSYKLVQFGEGPKMLAAELGLRFESAERPVGAYTAFSKMLDKDVLEVLYRHADGVLKGVL